MTRSRPAKSYLLHGLCVRSELLLAARETGGPLHDVAITIGQTRPVPDLPPAGRLLSHIDLPTGSSSLVTRDSRYILRVHRYCDFELSDGLGSICAHLPPHLDEEYASLLVGGVLATVLTLKGCSVLHASAVEVSGQVVAFVAGSGMGKTTLAALCCASGAKLVTDDVLRIETARDGGWCFAGTSELRLRPPLADLAESLSDGPSQSTVDERYSAGPPATAATRLPIRAFVLPRLDPAAAPPRVDRIRGADAVRELVSFPRTFLAWHDNGVARRDFAVLARLGGLVPVYRATLPQKLEPGHAEALLGAVGTTAAPVRSERASACSFPSPF